jgi:F420-non-reducing hydrogenase iron-sulfur subunit
MTLLAQEATAAGRPGSAPTGWAPKLVAFVCTWCSYQAADLAGTTRLPYASNVRIVRVPCTGRLSAEMLLHAFTSGADGVLVAGCHPTDCHYTSGNLSARRRWIVFARLLDFLGIPGERIRFAWVSASEGRKWADLVTATVSELQRLGPFSDYHHLEHASAAL